MTTGESFIEIGVVTPVQLVDDHLPNRMASRRAASGVAVTLVRHPVVERVGPDGNAAEGRRDRRVVHEELIGHHLELLVASDAEERSANADHGAVGDVREAFDDQSSSRHLGEPVIIGTLSPVLGVIPIRNREDADLVTSPVKLLNGRVVGVLVRDVERALQAAAVRVLPLSVENGSVEIDVVAVDGAIERDGDHLRHLCRVNVARHAGAVGRAEAIGQLTLGQVAVGRPVGVLVDGTSVLVRAVGTIRLLVAKEFLVNTLAVAALQLVIGADGLVGDQVRQDAAGLREPIAAVDLGLPVASLPVDVKGQSGGTTNGR